MEHNKTWKIYWKGVVLQSNIDAKLILKRARLKLTTEVLRNSSCNNLLPIIPVFGFEDTEIDSLKQETLTPQDWSRKFINILLNRHNLFDCLHILCNLHKHKLGNYQALIIGLFKSLPNVEVKEVVAHTDRDEDVETKEYVMFQGNKIKLKKLMHQITAPVDKKIRDELANGNVPIVVNNQVPDKLKYYVHRTVMSRNRLTVDVLKHDCNDVFVIEGMDRHELSSFVKDTETTDVSGKQLKKLTARFILLQYSEDFDKIRKLANVQSVPVHWVKHKDGKLQVVEFSGSAEILHKYIANFQDSCLEDELASSTQKVVIITDSPGMGKTSLLANIAHQIMRDDDQHTTLIRFIVLHELVQALSNKTINVESIIKIIAEQSSEYEFGRKFVEHSLKIGPCVLMFDGFDEVHSNQISNAKEVLQAAATLPQTRIFVATRRNLQVELEKTFQVLGFTIQPFEESNQIEFLLKFWEMKGALSNDSLINFTKACLKQLTSKMTDSERDIAGIPLQCRLLAEAYEEDAIRCSSVGYHLYEGSNSSALIDSIYGMYQRYVNMQFQKIFKQRFSVTRYENIKRVHMYHALQLLFPDHTILIKTLNTSSLPINELCELGLLEATQSNDIRFVHRTFAEFLVAWFVYENTKTSSVHQNFTLSTIFKTNQFKVPLKLPGSLYYDNVNLPCFKFVFPVISYFVNEFQRKENQIYFNSSHYLERILPICTAAAYHNYDQIPCFIGKCISFTTNTQMAIESDIGNLLLIAARYSSLELMKVLFSNIHIASMSFINYKQSWYLDAFLYTPLHMAVMRGDYNVVKYLLTLFENKLGEYRYLVHFCVFGSRSDSDYIVKEKINIIKLLMEKNKKCIDEKTKNEITPIMQSNVNSRLVVFLTQAGADINIINESGESVLDEIIRSTVLAPESLHEIVESFSKRGFQNFNKRDGQGVISLHRAVEKSELLIATLKLFQSNNADLNAVDYENNSVLFYAICGGRSAMFIKDLINLGADWEHINDNQQNGIHVSTKYGNVDAIKYFMEAYKMDVNVQDIHLNTPLHLAAVFFPEKQEAMIGFLINNGANVNLKNDKRQVPFIAAFEVGNGLSVNAMIQMEKKGLYITSTLASQALKAVFFKHHQRELLTFLPNDSIQYLIEKGGQIFYKFKDNFWRLIEVQKHMPVIIEVTQIIATLLSASKEHGLLSDQDYEKLQNSQEELKSEWFYQIVQEKSFPIERMYLILRNHKQLRALKYLQMCMEDCRRRLFSTMFLIPHPILMKYTQTVTPHMIVLETNCVELSVRKIQETIDKNAVVLEKHDLVLTSKSKLPPALIILKCEIVTDALINEVISFRNKWNQLVLLCSQVNSSIASEKCEIVTDHHSWDDISSHCKDILFFKFDNTVYNIDELFVSPTILKVIDKHNMVIKIPEVNAWTGKLSNFCNMFRIIGYKVGHLTKKSGDVYLSSKLFHYIFPVKFIFINITEKKLRTLAKYGQKIGVFGIDTNYCDYDYIIVQHTYQFEEICKETEAGLNIHLVDNIEGLFKLVRTMGYDANIKSIFEKPSLCESFPLCSCEVVDATIIQFSIVDENEDIGLQRVCEISTEDLLPEARQILGLQESIELFEFQRCYKNIQQQTSQLNQSCVNGQLQHDSQVPELVNNFFTCLTFPDNEMNLLKEVAVNTIFPQVNGNIEISSLEKYVRMKLLSYKGNSFVFVHEAWAGYLIAQSFVNQKPDEAVTSFYKVVIDQTDHVRNARWSISKYGMGEIHSFKFNNSWLFRFIDFFVSKLNSSGSFTDLIAKNMSTATIFKWIHACINDNLFNLLKILVGIGENEIIFKSTDLVMLAVRYGDVPMIEMVLKKYNKQTNLSSKDIKPKQVKNTTDHSQSVIFPAILVAASRGNYSVVEYLLNNYFEGVLINQLLVVLRATVRDTHMNEYTVIRERKLILEYLFQNQTSLIEEASKSLLLVSYIHIDLIIYLINLGIDTQTTNQDSDNILHFCSTYLTPQQYELLVKTLYEMGETKLFLAKNIFQETPLHVAVEHLELLDSTIDLFSSAGVDLNAVNKWNNTVLHISVISQRSAHFLNSLIKVGADPKKLGNYKRTTLHAAAEFGNLSALRYLISVGSDVNARDEDNSTPLHLALRYSKTYTYEIVKVLVNHGADVKARNDFQKSILDCAIQRKSCESKDILVEFLQKNGAYAPVFIQVKLNLSSANEH